MFIATIGIVAHRGFPAAGTLLSSYCQPPASGYVTDYYNSYYYGAYEAVYVLADGYGGTTSGTGINMYGCWVPSGFVHSASNSDIKYPGPYGDVLVGYYSESTMADGLGGSVFSSGSSYNYACDGVYASQDTTDVNNFPATKRWHIDCAGNSYYITEYINAGVVINWWCSASDAYDANNNIWYNVPFQNTTYADGSGGYYSEALYNTLECGYLPGGWALSPTVVSSLTLSYDDQYFSSQSWAYGTRYTYHTANGSGGENYMDSDTINYSSGYVFYSYYDFGQDYYYHFDGYSGYYVNNNPTY
jgi:hypothetical protein